MIRHIDTFFKIISSKNKDEEKRSYAAPLFVVIAITISCMFIAARFSYTKYAAFLTSNTWGLVATSLVAIIMFLLTGFLAKEYAKSTFGDGSQKPVSILIFFTVLTTAIGYGDYWVNSAGAQEIAKDKAGEISTINFQSLSQSEDDQLKQIARDKEALTSGKLGYKYGWTNGKNYELNNSGKARLNELDKKEADILRMKGSKIDHTQAEANLINADILEKRNILSTMFYYVVMFVYVLMMAAAYLAEVLYMKIQTPVHNVQTHTPTVKLTQNEQSESVHSKDNEHPANAVNAQTRSNPIGFQQNGVYSKVVQLNNQDVQTSVQKTGGLVNNERTQTIVQKEIDLGGNHPRYTKVIQPEVYKGIDEEKYNKFVPEYRRMESKGKINKTEIAKCCGISRGSVYNYIKVAQARKDI